MTLKYEAGSAYIDTGVDLLFHLHDRTFVPGRKPQSYP